MKYATVIASALALATSVVSAAPSLEKRHCLTDAEAATIIAKFTSILEGVDYNGQTPDITAKQVVAKHYTEYSDSILSLEGTPLGSDTPSATSRKQWFNEVSAHPDSGIQTLDILHSCDKIMWHWLFPNVGSGQYEVKGFNLLTLNNHGHIVRADIEFNSIAWGLDTQQLLQYCPTGPAPSASASASAAPIPSATSSPVS